MASADGSWRAGSSGLALTDMGWEVYPSGLTELLLRPAPRTGRCRRCTSRRTARPSATPWWDGCVHDGDRVAYLAAHIAAVGDALAQGVPVAGYMVWSLP